MGNNTYSLKQRKSFAFNLSDLSVQTVVRYLCEYLLIFLLASVDKFGLALALGLFVGLVYAKQNLVLLAPIYLLANITFALNWWTVLYCAVPIVLLICLYAFFYHIKRNVPIYLIALTALVSMVPYSVCTVLFGGDMYEVILADVLAVVFSFCCTIVCYAILLRTGTGNYTLDEQICGGICVAVFSFALVKIHIEEFYLFFILAGFVIALCSDNFKPATTLFTAMLMGAGASVYFGDLSPLGSLVAWAGVAVALSSFTRFASGAGIVAVDALLWLVAGYTGSGWQTLILVSVGVILYVFMPKAIRSRIARISKNGNEMSMASIVNRNRNDLSSKLYSVSDVFYDMSKSLEKVENKEGNYTALKLAKEISQNYCGRCSDREKCFMQLGGDTTPVIEPMANAVLARGKVTILDMPPFITSRCSKMHNLVSVINSAGESYQKRKEQASGVEIGKKMMSEQFAGVALVLDSLARDCGEQVRFSGEITDGITTELLRHNILAYEIVVSGMGESTKAVLTVREQDAEKAVLPRIVSQKLKTNLEVASVYNRGDKRIVHLESSPTFEIAYGIAEKIRSGNGVSGDSKSILCPSRRRRLFAISDGMGSGSEAAKASHDAISMVESFYRAGFDNAITLSLVNKLLKLSDNDVFSSLDIAVIDTVSGGMDVIKLGTSDSFIVHRDSIETIASCTPPAGILDKVDVVTNRVQLFDGDMVIMMSDGVYDALDTKGVTTIVDRMSTLNPQTLADELLAQALESGAEDDCTVMVLRVFCL